MTPELYGRLSDYQVCEVYFAPRDKEDRLVRFWERNDDEEPNALRGFSSAEELGVPREALLCGVPMDFVLMFWTVWRQRGKDAPWILNRFREYLKRQYGEKLNGHHQEGRR